MEHLALIQTGDLKNFLKEVLIDRFSNVEVDTHTVKQILNISQSTVNRYVENNLLRVTNPNQRNRKFILSDILYMNRQDLKKQNRLINTTQYKPKRQKQL
jgi:hypothetical protein